MARVHFGTERGACHGRQDKAEENAPQGKEPHAGRSATPTILTAVRLVGGNTPALVAAGSHPDHF
jgi:hypothetical protein